MESTRGIWGIPCNHVTYVTIQEASDIPPVYPSSINGFVVNMRQAIIWTNDGLGWWRI